MATEPITGLTYQEANSLQTDVLQNEQLNYFAAWIPAVVKTLGDSAPPGSPVDGDCHVIGTSATGAWAGKDKYLAVYRGGWQFYAPRPGVRVSNLDDGKIYVYLSGSWSEYTVPTSASAENVSYDNSGSGLDADNVQDAIDEIVATVVIPNKHAQVMLSDLSTALTSGSGKGIWFAPEDGELKDIWIAVGAASSSGSVTVDLNDSGGSVLTTQPSIDSGEPTSLTGTSAVLDGVINFVKGDKFTFDIDASGTGAKALMATLEYQPA